MYNYEFLCHFELFYSFDNLYHNCYLIKLALSIFFSHNYDLVSHNLDFVCHYSGPP